MATKTPNRKIYVPDSQVLKNQADALKLGVKIPGLNPTPQKDTPTPPSDTSTDTKRYQRTPNANDKSISDAERKLREATSVEPDLATITAEKRQQAQAVIDSISAQFQKTLEDQGVMNAGLNDRVRALNVSSGLQGSDFATGAAVAQEKKNQGAIDLINKEKFAKIQEVLAGADARASEEYRAQRAEYIKGLGDNITALKQARDEDRQRAKETITGLASQGVDIAKLKSTDSKTYNTLLQEYGGSELDLETAWNASLPEDKKTKYETKTIRGENGNAIVLRYGFNPLTGKTESKEYDMGIPYSKVVSGKSEVKELDGQLWNVTTDENGDTVAKPLTEVSAFVKSQIAKNYADAQTVTDNKGFKFSSAQRTKLISSDFNDEKINAIESDLKKYGVKKVLDGFSTQEEKDAVSDALKSSSLAEQLAEYAKNN